MEFQCVICKTKVELSKEQLKTIYELGNGYPDVPERHELGDGYPTVAELCDILSRIKRKTCGKEETKKIHVFTITDKERDFMDPIIKEDKETSEKLNEVIPEAIKTKIEIDQLEKELIELREKDAGLSKTEVELYHKKDSIKNEFMDRYGHSSIELWS